MEAEMVTMTSNEGTNISNPTEQFKGVLLLPSGHWGARIATKGQRFWLGSFNSKKEAAMAYDSAAIKLGRMGSHRNLPVTEVTAREHTFQQYQSTEEILEMIKDGSYIFKLTNFWMRHCQNTRNHATNPRPPREEEPRFQELFHKQLTASDVGKAGRLAIPKKSAVTHFFPRAPDEVNPLNITFVDNGQKLWTFRCCYWRCSKIFVFNHGWRKFVKKKGLKAKDTVVFYRVYSRGVSGEEKMSYFIDPKKNSGEIRIDSNVNSEQLQRGDTRSEISFEKEDKGDGVEVQKGFKLFGVYIG